MTKSAAQKARDAEARAAKAAEAPLVSDGPADLAPLDPPTDEPQPGADLDGFGGDAPKPADVVDEPAVVIPDAPEVLEEPVAPVTPAAAKPASVELEAPAPLPSDDDEDEEPFAVTLTEAAAKKFVLGENRITDHLGNDVDPDEVFTEANSSGEVRSKYRLVEHVTITEYDRPTEVLVIAAGSAISNQSAAGIVTRLREQQA